MRISYLPVLLVALLLAACSRAPQNNEAAVRQGVLDYLSAKSDLNLSQMQVDVKSVSYRKDEADATVTFRPKGGGDAAGMQMKYTLERKGDKWVVKGRAASTHGQMPAQGGGMPAGHPPTGMPPQNPPAPAK